MKIFESTFTELLDEASCSERIQIITTFMMTTRSNSTTTPDLTTIHAMLKRYEVLNRLVLPAKFLLSPVIVKFSNLNGSEPSWIGPAFVHANVPLFFLIA